MPMAVILNNNVRLDIESWSKLSNYEPSHPKFNNYKG